MRWVDVFDVAIALEEAHPNEDILRLSFTKLQQMILALPGFSGHEKECNEKILEAIQQAWLEER